MSFAEVFRSRGNTNPEQTPRQIKIVDTFNELVNYELDGRIATQMEKSVVYPLPNINNGGQEKR